MSNETSYSEFKKQFKFYKKRDRKLDLSSVINPSSLKIAKFEKMQDSNTLILFDRLIKRVNGLRPIHQWSFCTFAHKPGLFIISGLLTAAEQLLWIERSLLEYSEPPNVTNLRVQGKNPYKGRNVFKNCGASKLRWVTMGIDYNWDTKTYADVARQTLPVEISDLAKLVVGVLGLGDFYPDAAIINYYPEKSFLSPHVDRSERDLNRPLVSISLGQPAVYLTGGTSLDEQVDAILLRSGDILVMSGEQRLVYHAVPRILDGAQTFGGEEDGQSSIFDKQIVDYANHCRVNITVRQVSN